MVRRQCCEEVEEEEEAEEEVKWEEAEANVKGSEDEEDLMDPRDPLEYNRRGAAVEAGGDGEGVIIISDSFNGNETRIEGLEIGLEEMDILEESTSPSRPLKRIFRDFIADMVIYI